MTFRLPVVAEKLSTSGRLGPLLVRRTTRPARVLQIKAKFARFCTRLNTYSSGALLINTRGKGVLQLNGVNNSDAITIVVMVSFIQHRLFFHLCSSEKTKEEPTCAKAPPGDRNIGTTGQITSKCNTNRGSVILPIQTRFNAF